jgi:hypothetical protein
LTSLEVSSGVPEWLNRLRTTERTDSTSFIKLDQ